VRLASEDGHLAVVKYLVSHGADIHANNDSSVRSTSYNGHLDVVAYLVSQGADIHADNDSSVRSASSNGHLDVVAYLVSQGAPITHLPEFHRRYVSIYLKHYKPYKTRATSRIYFWWIQKCYRILSSKDARKSECLGSGIRMCLASLARHEALCAAKFIFDKIDFI